jgi:hypothetical protein
VTARVRVVCIATAVFAAAALVQLGAGQPLAADAPKSARVTPDTEWNAVFDRTDGWTGADCAGSVDLGDGRTLWMFGDTWIGKIHGGKRQPGATMVNNSIAVHPTDKSAPWRPPDPRSVQFLWGPTDKQGRPTAWVVPPVPSAETEKGDSAKRLDWFWCNGGGFVTGREKEKGRRLVVFLFRVRRDPHGKGVWNFRTVGTSLAIVDNLSDPPREWHPRVFDIPGTGRIADASRGESVELLLGMSAARQDGPPSDAGALLIFGTRQRVFDMDLVMARAPASTPEQFADWRFFVGPQTSASTSTNAQPLAKGLVSEFSVEKFEDRGRSIWVLVQSEPLLGKRIYVRTAQRPEGPWSAPRTIYTVPDVAKSRAYFTYAAKGHASLSRPSELLVTYLVNSQNFGDLMGDTTIYRPKFLRVPAAVIFDH